VAASGWPLYYYAEDSSPGEATGQGAGGAWWVLAPDGTPKMPTRATIDVRSHDEHGDILVDGDGRTLYMFDRDEQDAEASACTSSGCLNAWPPVTTGLEPTVGDAVTAQVTTFARDDARRQVAANGWPLYYFRNDESPGDASGQGANDVWWVLGPDGVPIRSSPGTATPTQTATDDDGVSY
jgi:predicted lipoprotein with Yx(FWY)xxD motif